MTKIIIVMDNSENPNLLNEHGLSLYIEKDDSKILFDVGRSNKTLINAEKLGIDISNIDYLILSHGHYDHTGGLYDFLKINKKAKIIYKKDIFENKYNQERYIGIFESNPQSVKKMIIENNNPISKDILEIVPNFFVISKIRIFNQFDTHFKNLFKKYFIFKKQDNFTDELFLIIKENSNINILTGCAHRGITNITQNAKILFPHEKINSILGGFHLSKESLDVKKIVINQLKDFNFENLIPLHCSGVIDKESINIDNIRIFTTGDTIIL